MLYMSILQGACNDSTLTQQVLKATKSKSRCLCGGQWLPSLDVIHCTRGWSPNANAGGAGRAD